jgi:hypothetical protein
LHVVCVSPLSYSDIPVACFAVLSHAYTSAWNTKPVGSFNSNVKLSSVVAPGGTVTV